MLHHAKIWKYTGNHAQGRDHTTYDPHNYGVDLTGYLVYVENGGECMFPLMYSDASNIRVTYHNKTKTSFGVEVSVAAPPEIWEAAKQSFEKLKQGKFYV